MGFTRLALGLLLLALQQEAKPEWQEFRSVEGNFLVWIPAKPEEIKVKGCPPGAQVWQASGDSLLTLFQFGYIGRQKAREDKEISEFLDGLAAESAESLKGSVTSVKKVTVSGWPGRENRIRFDAGEVPMVLLERVVLARDVKLFVRVILPEAEESKPQSRRILDSFKLVDERRGAGE